MNKIYSVKETAETLQVSIETVRRLIRSKKLKAAKFGNTYRIEEKDLEELMRDLKENR